MIWLMKINIYLKICIYWLEIKGEKNQPQKEKTDD